VDDYHGVQVADPYRWLEDADSEETRAWIAAQNRLTFGYLASVPARDRLQERLTHLWNYERFGVPFQEGGQYFYTRNTGLQNEDVLYVAGSLQAEPQVLLDPEALWPYGTVALSGLGIRQNGEYLAYALSGAGSDWMEWRVREVAACHGLPNQVKLSKFLGVPWARPV